MGNLHARYQEKQLLLHVPIKKPGSLEAAYYLNNMKKLLSYTFLCLPIISHLYIFKKTLHYTLTNFSPDTIPSSSFSLWIKG